MVVGIEAEAGCRRRCRTAAASPCAEGKEDAGLLLVADGRQVEGPAAVKGVVPMTWTPLACYRGEP
jgi:hypothetical protein